MPGKPDQLVGQREHGGEQRIGGVETGFAHVPLGQRAARVRAPHHAGQRRDGILAQPHHLADVAHRRAGAIGNDGRGDTGAVAAVALVDVLDHLLAPLVLEIDVDVGRLAPFRGDEALEQQVDFRRIDTGDPQAIAHDRVGGRAAPLRQDALPMRKGDDVVDGQKIGGIGKLRDEGQLALERVQNLCRYALREASVRTRPRNVFQMPLRCFAGGRWFLGIFVDEFLEGKAAGVDDFERSRQSPLVAFEQTRHVRRRAQVALCVGGKPRPGLGDADARAHAYEHVLQGSTVRGVIERIARGHDRRADARADLVERCDARAVVAPVGVRCGEIHASCGGERGAQPAQLPFEGGAVFFRRVPAPILRRKRDENLSLRVPRDIGEAQAALAFFCATLTQRQQTAEPAIGAAVARKTQQARRILEIETRADDETQAHRLRRRVRAHDARQRVAIGNGQRREPQRLGLGYEFVRMRGALQEREVAGHLQLGIGGERRFPVSPHRNVIRHAKNPCRNQRGGSGASSCSSSKRPSRNTQKPAPVSSSSR